MNYSYPFDIEWTKQEIMDVIQFFTLIEQAYEKKADRIALLTAYHKLKEVVPAKSEEKQLFSRFEKDSGYSSYHVIKKAMETDKQYISM